MMQNASSLLTPLRKVRTALTCPGAFFRYQSNGIRTLYHNVARVAHPLTFARRCRGLANVNEPLSLAVPDQDGYAVFTPDQIPDDLARQVLDEVRGRLSSVDIESIRKTANKPYLLAVIDGKDIGRDSAVYRFVTHPVLVGCVARYLKCFPILTYISVWYSPNLPGEDKGSQKYHLDHEDYRQIKAFMFIEDIGPQNGPFTLLPASRSEKIQSALGYKMTPDNKQVDDEVIYGIVDRHEAVPLVGPAGTVALIDTSRCFHYGSREGTAPRIMLAFQYMTPFAYVMPWNWRHKKFLPHLHGANLSPPEKKLLGLEV